MNPTHMQAQKTIDGIPFPAGRAEIIAYARDRGADLELLECMCMIPDRTYREPNEVGRVFAEVAGQ